MRKIAGALLCALASLSARATNFATDATDLWWNANESGWGVNVVQQYDTLFMTFFVYGSNGTPTWYVAPAVTFAPGNPIEGTVWYKGLLYQTSGPYFGGSFNPNAVTNRVVGSVSFLLASDRTASLTYTVDGVNVTKSLTRQTWTAENFTGSYVGGQTGTLAGCSANGSAEEADVFAITQNGTSFSLVASNVLQSGASCTYTGTYSQDGHLGAVSGNYQCTTGAGGTFSMFQVDGTLAGFTAQVATHNGGCSFVGRMAGARRSS